MPLTDRMTFGDDGLVPAIITDDATGAVLTLCHLNREALEKTLRTGEVHVYRRSQGRVMKKGATSGHVQRLKQVFIDCEGNSLLFRVEQNVAACHKGYFTCYFMRYDPRADTVEVTEEQVFRPEDVY